MGKILNSNRDTHLDRASRLDVLCKACYEVDASLFEKFFVCLVDGACAFTPRFPWEAAPKVLCARVINDELGVERENMVYCTKCGTNNVEGATVCVNCGAPLYGASGVSAAYTGHVRYERHYHGHMRSGTIAGLVLGVMVVFIGLSLLLEQYGITVPWWEILIILLGVYLIWRWSQLRNRRR